MEPQTDTPTPQPDPRDLYCPIEQAAAWCGVIPRQMLQLVTDKRIRAWMFGSPTGETATLLLRSDVERVRLSP